MFSITNTSTLYSCLTDDGAIILDLATEKYYFLQKSAVSSNGDISFLNRRCIQVHSGTLCDKRRLPLQSIRHSTLDTIKYTRAILHAALNVVINMNIFTMPEVIRSITNLKRRYRNCTLQSPTETLPAAIDVFRRLRSMLYTSHNNCLTDSMILFIYLTRLHYNVEFVIGIRTRTFEAHAWVQCEDYLCEDTPERVQNFMPILIV